MGYITPKAIEIDIEEDISYAEWKLSKERK
jgi:hypothetical protein